MKRIGIIYISTGPYNAFWEDYFRSCEQNFLPDVEKHYYIFTDLEQVYGEDTCNRIHRHFIDHQPWPLVTLLKFRTILSIEQELIENDYITFTNSNILCENTVTSQEYLPREEQGEELFFTQHPGFAHVPVWKTTLDRNPACLAYVPYNVQTQYVYGAMNGGTTKAYLRMCRTLAARIEEDLKRNVIALWHDESHINRYIIGKTNYRLLSPAYCYPCNIPNYPAPRKLCEIDKRLKFDVKTFKGQYEPAPAPAKPPLPRRLYLAVRSAVAFVYRGLFRSQRSHYLRDCLLRKSIPVLDAE